MACASLGPLQPMPQLRTHSAQWQAWGPAVVDLSGDWRSRLAARFPHRYARIAEAVEPAEGINLTFAASISGAKGRAMATTRWLLTMEQTTKRRLLWLLADVCKRSASQVGAARAHFLDIGSNIGFYGMTAASLGCSVDFFDMQCACATAVADSLLANSLQHRALIHPVGVSDERREFPSDAGDCSGRYPQVAMERKSRDPRIDSGSARLSGVGRTMPLVQLLPVERLSRGAQIIAKVDVEGNEIHVLRGLLPFLKRRLISHLFVEVTTGFGFYARLGVSRLEMGEMFVQIMGFGYTLTDIPTNTTHSSKSIRHFFKVSETQVDLLLQA